MISRSTCAGTCSARGGGGRHPHRGSPVLSLPPPLQVFTCFFRGGDGAPTLSLELRLHPSGKGFMVCTPPPLLDGQESKVVSREGAGTQRGLVRSCHPFPPPHLVPSTGPRTHLVLVLLQPLAQRGQHDFRRRLTGVAWGPGGAGVSLGCGPPPPRPGTRPTPPTRLRPAPFTPSQAPPRVWAHPLPGPAPPPSRPSPPPPLPRPSRSTHQTRRWRCREMPGAGGGGGGERELGTVSLSNHRLRGAFFLPVWAAPVPLPAPAPLTAERSRCSSSRSRLLR